MPVKPHDQEEEFFFKQELERKRHNILHRESLMAQEEKQRLKALHWMRCPKDGSELVETQFQGVSVDVCATCGGMFLDAGELEQISASESGFLGRLKGFLKV